MDPRRLWLILVALVIVFVPLAPLARAQDGTPNRICVTTDTERHLYTAATGSRASPLLLRDGEDVTVYGAVLPGGRVQVRTFTGRRGYADADALCTPSPAAFCDGPFMSGDGTIDDPARGFLMLTYTNRTGGLSIGLDDLEERRQINTYTRPDAGHVFVVASVLVLCHQDTEGTCRFNNNDFGLVVDGSYVVEPSSATYALPDNNWGTVFPGGSVDGQLVFEVRSADADKDLALYYGDQWVICRPPG